YGAATGSDAVEKDERNRKVAGGISRGGLQCHQYPGARRSSLGQSDRLPIRNPASPAVEFFEEHPTRFARAFLTQWGRPPGLPIPECSPGSRAGREEELAKLAGG